MKKQFIISALVFVAAIFGAQNAMAQVSTEVRILLSDVISIVDGIAVNGQVDFTYENAEDYNSDKTAKVANSLIVTSTKSFDIKVKAEGSHFDSGSEKIPVDVVTITPVDGRSMGGTPKLVKLSTDDQTLIEKAAPGNRLILDLEYKIPKEKSSSSDILGKPAGTYVQKITYTAVAL